MASASLRSTLRAAVAVGAFGALATFGTVATAGAQEVQAPSFGSLGSVSGLIDDWGNFDNFFGGSVGGDGSLAGVIGSVGGSLGDSDSQGNALETATGSDSGSSASIGQIAGNIDPEGLEETNTGSGTMSTDLTGMLGAVNGGSISGLFESGSNALGALN